MLKKPVNGGTPANEKRKTVIKNKKKLLKLNVFNEYKVFKLVTILEFTIQKNPIKVKL